MFLSVLYLVVYIVSPDTMFRPVYDRLERAQKDQPAQQREPLPPYKKWLQEQQLVFVVGSIVGLGGRNRLAATDASLPGKQMRALREYDQESGCVAARQTARALL